jgi:hypothetical protein
MIVHATKLASAGDAIYRLGARQRPANYGKEANGEPPVAENRIFG